MAECLLAGTSLDAILAKPQQKGGSNAAKRLVAAGPFWLSFASISAGQVLPDANVALHDMTIPSASLQASAPSLSTATADPAQPAKPPSAEAENRVTVQGTVTAVDYEKRTVTLRGRLGQVVSLDIPPTVTGLEQIKVGDLVTTTYFDRVNVRVKPAGEPAVDRIVEPTVTQQPGAVPGATVSRQREATVTITAWTRRRGPLSSPGRRGGEYQSPTTMKALRVAVRMAGFAPGETGFLRSPLPARARWKLVPSPK